MSISGSDELNYPGVATITTKQGFLTDTFARLEGAILNDGKLFFPTRTLLVRPFSFPCSCSLAKPSAVLPATSSHYPARAPHC